jgi:2,5-diamino-6-(ribosylamino)-4(3H)-pyrimidinone 5'-phosphate reductase
MILNHSRGFVKSSGLISYKNWQALFLTVRRTIVLQSAAELYELELGRVAYNDVQSSINRMTDMKRPFVYINVAMTADGKIDTFQRKGAAISSERDKERVDRLRAEADAIMVGGKTLLDEDPKLTVKSEALRAERLERGLSPNPIKVGVITEARLRDDSEFLNSGPANIVIFTTRWTSKHHISLLKSRGADVYVDDSERVNLFRALETLKEIGVERLMVEGGATLNFELLRLGLVDEVTAYVAPLIFGGATAPTLAAGSGLERGEAIPLKLADVEKWEDGGVLVKYILESK